MVQFVDKILSFLSYWYLRYMLATELYMVEQWERNFINIFMFSLFTLFFFFNYKVLVPAVTSYMLSE